MTKALLQSEIGLAPAHRGKVRDVYDLGEHLLLVATDRISAFDAVSPTAIPGKGVLLTQMSLFWFDLLGFPHHLVATETKDSICLRLSMASLWTFWCEIAGQDGAIALR